MDERQKAFIEALRAVGNIGTLRAIALAMGTNIVNIRPIASRVPGVDSVNVRTGTVRLWYLTESEQGKALSNMSEKAKLYKRAKQSKAMFVAVQTTELENELAAAHKAVRRQNAHIRNLEMRCNDAELRAIEAEERASGADIDRFYRTAAWEEIRVAEAVERREKEMEAANQTLRLIMKQKGMERGQA